MNKCMKCGVDFIAPTKLKEYCPTCWRIHRIAYCKSAYEKRAIRKRIKDNKINPHVFLGPYMKKSNA